MGTEYHATWTVESQTPVTRAGRTGQIDEGYDVAFLTGEGHAGVVFLPNSQYTVDRVRAAVQAQADLLDAVGALTGNGSAG